MVIGDGAAGAAVLVRLGQAVAHEPDLERLFDRDDVAAARIARIAQGVDLHVAMDRTFHAGDLTPAPPSGIYGPAFSALTCQRRIHGIGQKHGNGHRPHAARNGRNPGRPFGRGRVFDVSGEFPVGKPVDSDIDHHRTITNPYTWDVRGFSDRGDHEIRALHLALQITRSRVTYRDGGAPQQQFQRHGPPDDVGGAHDHRPHAGHVDARIP